MPSHLNTFGIIWLHSEQTHELIAMFSDICTTCLCRVSYPKENLNLLVYARSAPKHTQEHVAPPHWIATTSEHPARGQIYSITFECIHTLLNVSGYVQACISKRETNWSTCRHIQIQLAIPKDITTWAYLKPWAHCLSMSKYNWNKILWACKSSRSLRMYITTPGRPYARSNMSIFINVYTYIWICTLSVLMYICI